MQEKGDQMNLRRKKYSEGLHDLAELRFSVVFAGGEPYLRRDFPEILDYAASLGFVIAIVTNGSLLTPELARRIPKDRCQ